LRDLETLITLYLEPMASKRVVDSRLLDLILGALKQFQQVNKELLRQLQESENVGAAFMHMSPYLLLYSSYCANQHDLTAEIERIRKGKGVKEKEKEQLELLIEYSRHQPQCRGVDASGFLIKPIQRLCKYPLFLGQLKKETTSSHPDYAAICSALDMLSKVVAEANEKKAELDSLKRLANLADIVSGFDRGFTLITPTRRLLQEGQIELVKRKGTKSITYFLCNDLLLLTKANSSATYDSEKEILLGLLFS